MKYTKLPKTSAIKVSKICLGTMTWGNQNTQEEAFEQMDYALEQGVNFFDTAELYPVPATPANLCRYRTNYWKLVSKNRKQRKRCFSE